MMQIVYFFQKDQFLTEMQKLEGEKVYVLPSPTKADGLRSQLTEQKSQDVITIAKFTSQLINELWKESESIPLVKRKSELLLVFGILKNKYLPDLGYEQFTQAYNLFSDLRSFTLDLEALNSILEEQPEVVKRAILLFWKLLDVTGFHDEHGAYQLITEKLRNHEEDEELNKTYIFWGFQHLNGQQVDLLKALSIRYQVIIPFPAYLKDKLKRSDWLSWLKDSKTIEKTLEDSQLIPQAQWVSINSREVSKTLKHILKRDDQILLGVSKLSPSHIDFVPSQSVSFKIPHQILGHELSEIFDELKSFSGTHNQLKDHCLGKLKTCKTMKYFKAWQLYIDGIDLISDLSDEVQVVDLFFVKLLNEVVLLNQPRTSFVPVSKEEFNIELKDMSSIDQLERKRRTVICIDERFDEIQSFGQNYVESVQKVLSTLGPIKRNELDFQFKIWEFKDLLSNGEAIVLINKDTLKHSLGWKRLFEGISLKEYPLLINQKTKSLIDLKVSPEKKNFGTFSASKFQTYIDCPRKFYFKYVEDLFPQLSLEQDFDPLLSGMIVHEIIEKFFKEKKNLDDLKSLTKRITQEHIRVNNLLIPSQVLLQRELTFYHRVKNGIEFIHKIQDLTGESIHWKIEEPFKLGGDLPLTGRIDCMGVGSRYLFLLDFKSTESSAASATEVSDLSAIQLWTYAYASRHLIEDIDSRKIILGYIVLDDSSKSVILSDEDELIEKIKTEKMCKSHKFKNEIKNKLIEVKDKFIELQNQIANDSRFPSRPRNPSVCHFCDVNKVCIKSELVNG